MPDITEILKKAKRRQKTVVLCLAGDEVANLERLEKELAVLGDAWQPDSLAEADPRRELAEKVAAARAAIRSSETEFRFEALGAKAWSDLIAAHPSQNQGEAFDPETFAPALISACSVEPAMSVAQVKELFDVLNHAQREMLWQGAFDANTEASGIPFSLTASGILDSLTGGK